MRSHSYTLILLLGLPSACFGWGVEGHKIAAQIAAERLSPQAVADVKQLLGDQSLADVAAWADEVRRKPQYRWSGSLHYANVAPGADGYDSKRDCPGEQCVVGAIKRFAAILRDDMATRDQKAEALKFLAHFVADVHQPLHVSYAHDKGGNDIKVDFFHNRMDLHSVWDSGILRRARHERSWQEYEKTLSRQFTPEQARQWAQQMDPGAWATESFRLAVSNAYPIPKDAQLEQEYFERNLPVVNERLEMAGVRLAELLNSLLTRELVFPTSSSAPASAPVEKVRRSPATTQTTASHGPFVGRRGSPVYHYPSCKGARKIKPDKLVTYETAPEGKRLHAGCPN